MEGLGWLIPDYSLKPTFPSELRNGMDTIADAGV
jgi:hypothetical protein